LADEPLAPLVDGPEPERLIEARRSLVENGIP
jgi:hypothetical protein